MSAADNKRLLMVVHSTHSAVGGAELQALNLARSLSARGWKVRFLALAGVQSEPHHQSDGMEFISIAVPHVRFVAGLWLVVKFASYLIRNREEYDVVHVHIVKTLAFVAAVLGGLLGKRVVLKVSGITELEHGLLNGQRQGAWNRLLNYGCRKADTVVAISQRIASALQQRRYPSDRIACLPNGVDTTRYRPSTEKDARRRALGINGDKLVVAVGRLSPEKGLFDLLEAWIEVQADFPDARLCIVGDGLVRKSLEVLIRVEDALRNTVLLVGSSNRVEDYLAAAECYVSSSHCEGLSNTLLEAMAAGLPVVGTGVSGAEDIVEDGRSGVIIPPHDPKRLANGILRILADPAAAQGMGERSRAIAVERFDVERVVDHYERIYSGAR